LSSSVNIYAVWLIVMNGGQRNGTNAQIWGKVKRLELWWQLYRTSLPVWDLENSRPMDFFDTSLRAIQITRWKAHVWKVRGFQSKEPSGIALFNSVPKKKPISTRHETVSSPPRCFPADYSSSPQNPQNFFQYPDCPSSLQRSSAQEFNLCCGLVWHL